MPEHQENKKPTDNQQISPRSRVAFPALEPDRYKPMLDGMDVTDEQAEELLKVLWQIMCSFVELGFGTNSIQRIIPQIFGDFSDSSINALQLEHPKIEGKNTQLGDCDNAR